MEILLQLLEACTALQAGEPPRLTHRGGGLRLVLDVQLADGVTGVRVEREDGPARPLRAPRRRALPRGAG